MKTAISLPDDLFRNAEAAARKLKMSRSQLYAAALSEFLARRQSGKITQRLNEVYSQEPANVDSILNSAQLRSIDRENW
jgi:metal-responsive CopG/Arc/MetJ family transcriptional regulator